MHDINVIIIPKKRLLVKKNVDKTDLGKIKKPRPSPCFFILACLCTTHLFGYRASSRSPEIYRRTKPGGLEGDRTPDLGNLPAVRATWWTGRDSNPLPLQCECSVLPGELPARTPAGGCECRALPTELQALNHSLRSGLG